MYGIIGQLINEDILVKIFATKTNLGKYVNILHEYYMVLTENFQYSVKIELHIDNSFHVEVEADLDKENEIWDILDEIYDILNF